MDWVDELHRLREARVSAVLVTLAAVRGHAPRNGGAKLVVSATGLFGTVGGGNLEATAVDRAREMLADGTAEPEMLGSARVGVPGSSGVFADAVARVRLRTEPVPEAAIGDLPAGTHVLIMTHDHVEDLAITDQALRTPALGSIGLIGSQS